jgi:threonine dehydrogenase-like Zn-dependent dehydrogenase
VTIRSCSCPISFPIGYKAAEFSDLAETSGAMMFDFMKEDIYDRIQVMTEGRGADACIDAVGTEPETKSGFDAVVDRIQGRDLHGNRSSACPSPGYTLLPQLRHGFDRWRLWRLRRQETMGSATAAASPFAWRRRRCTIVG